MTIDLEALEKMAKAATPGPWITWSNGFDAGVIQLADVVRSRPSMIVGGEPSEGYIDGPDAEFIASANPAVVLELLRRLRAAEAIVRDLAAKPSVLQRTLPTPMVGEYMTTIECAYCHARHINDGRLIVHAESCPYRRAVEAVR